MVRGFFPRASEAFGSDRGTRKPAIPARRISPEGFFEAVLPLSPELPISPTRYRWRVREPGQAERESYDTYAFSPLLSDFDLHLMGEGTHYQKYEKMGAHLAVIEGVAGVQFGVWAPNAMRVSVVGDFNQWDGRTHPMRNRGPSGVWELFVPGTGRGRDLQVRDPALSADLPMLKSDPYGFRSELRPKTGSVVARLDRHHWNDWEWIDYRAKQDWFTSPISVYELHLGSWRRVVEEGGRWLSYSELADQLIPYVKQMGYTHVELMPVMEHPFDGSWGYQTLGIFCRDQPVRRSGRLHVLCRPASPGGHRRDSGLDSRALPQRRARPCRVRRHSSLRARRPAPGPPSGLGQLWSSTTAATKSRIS